MASSTRRVPLTAFPPPGTQYDREGESQFRRGLERSLLSITAYVDGIVNDSSALATHDILSKHSAAGLTPGHFFKALSSTTFGFAAHGLTYSDTDTATYGSDDV